MATDNYVNSHFFGEKAQNAEKEPPYGEPYGGFFSLSHKQDAERVRAAVARDGAARLRLFDGNPFMIETSRMTPVESCWYVSFFMDLTLAGVSVFP